MQTEIILCDQKNKRLVVFDTKDMSRSTWEWTIDAPDFVNVSGVKYRRHPVWGEVVLVVASGGFTGVVAYPSGELLFRVHGSGNLHSVELLPDGRVMTVASDGNTVRIYTTPDTWNEFYSDFPHGVLYDPERDSVWVLARQSLCEYDINNFSEPKQTYIFPDGMTQGHDLAPIYGDTGHLFFSVLSGAFVYDKRTNTALPFVPCGREHIKGIGNLPNTDTVFCVTPNGYCKPWCTDKIYRYDKDGETEISTTDIAIYKLRIFCNEYQ